MTYMGTERRNGHDRRSSGRRAGDSQATETIMASRPMPPVQSSGISDAARSYDERMTPMRDEMMHRPEAGIWWPGVLIGFGIGGLVNGIVVRDLLQWHQTMSGTEAMSGAGLEMNLRANGIVAAGCLLIALVGVLWLWNAASMRRHDHWRGSGRHMIGWFLIGWAVFTIASTVVATMILGWHDVNETVAAGDRMMWNWGAVGVGVVVGLIGLALAMSRRDRIVRLPADVRPPSASGGSMM